jgi:hypothetical protein
MSDKTETKIDRLLDAIDLIKDDQREEARQILRTVIRDDGNFEDAWLWMSVAVDSIDQSTICLDNVLRINPANMQAAGALHRLRESEMQMERRRERLRSRRNLSFALMWILTVVLLNAVVLTFVF